MTHHPKLTSPALPPRAAFSKKATTLGEMKLNLPPSFRLRQATQHEDTSLGASNLGAPGGYAP